MDGQVAGRKWWLVVAAVVLLGAVLRVLAYTPYDTIAHDEILQYQERAFGMVFGYGIVPWETRYGVRNALIPDLLAAAMAGAKLFSGDHAAAVLTGRIVFALACLAALPAAYALGRARSRTHALVALFAAAVWFESVLFGVHVLSESIALPFACGGAAALLHARENRRAALLAGFLLTMAVLLRLQYVAFAGTAVLLTAGRDWRLYPRLILGALPALALGAATDLAAGQVPFAWVIANYTQNIVHGRAAFFGEAGPLFYVGAVFLRLMPLAPFILVGAVFAGRQYRPLLIAAVVNIAVHSLIGHKEYRFVWLSVFVFVILAAVASVDLVERLRARRGASPASRPAAIAALCLGWAAASLAGYFATGGFATLRDGGKVAELAARAADIPGTCGIGFKSSLRKSVAYAFLPRKLNLYLLSDAVDEKAEPLPPLVAEAADVLILTDQARPPAPYRRLGCEQDVHAKVCLYRREGGCTNVAAARPHTYEAALIKNDM